MQPCGSLWSPVVVPCKQGRPPRVLQRYTEEPSSRSCKARPWDNQSRFLVAVHDHRSCLFQGRPRLALCLCRWPRDQARHRGHTLHQRRRRLENGAHDAREQRKKQTPTTRGTLHPSQYSPTAAGLRLGAPRPWLYSAVLLAEPSDTKSHDKLTMMEGLLRSCYYN